MDGNEVELFHGHEGFVFTILVNNDFLFSAGDDGVVNIWNGIFINLLKGQEKSGTCLHPNTIWDMTFVGKDLVTGIYLFFYSKLVVMELLEYFLLMRLNGHLNKKSKIIILSVLLQ
jgi:WD40 repeat protein